MSTVVGTAGHIDHGKTSLVRSLTGVDLDALPEERERGITIALGFVPLDLPEGRRVALVDVPGHERLVRTMISGATGIDAVLLCVSAVDGVMPQTREHLAILTLLGLTQGAIVLTMADLVDEDLLELAAEDVAEVVEGTFLEGKPVIPFSAIEGTGRDTVLEVIAAFERASRSEEGPFRLPVDRAFTRAGFGTVVTGTIASGVLEDGSTVRLLPDGREARVRGLEVHGARVDQAAAGSRVAINLAGVEKSEVPRGTVVGSGPVPTPHMVDVRYRQLEEAGPLADGSPVRVLLGTAEVLGRLHVAEDRDEVPGGIGVWAQLRLDTPLPCLPGDRFIVRRTSPLETLGGGEVLDPWAARMRHRERIRYGQALERLAGGDLEVLLERAGEVGLGADEWLARSRAELGQILGGRRFARRIVARLEGALIEGLERYHREMPLSLGANRRELRRGRLGHLDERVFDALIQRLADSEMVEIEGPRIRLRGFSVTLGNDELILQQDIAKTLAEAGVGGILPKALFDKHKEPNAPALLHLLEHDGEARQVPGLGWVQVAALHALTESLQRWFASSEDLTPGDFKELTGLSRKGAIPLLEYLDRCRFTVRAGDARRRGPDLPTSR